MVHVVVPFVVLFVVFVVFVVLVIVGIPRHHVPLQVMSRQVHRQEDQPRSQTWTHFSEKTHYPLLW